MEVPDYLQKKGKLVDEEIERLLPEDVKPEVLGKANRHLFEAGGKRVRPVLTLTACEAVGGDTESALETAAALEILHTFTLVHDDIMDRDEFRRGAETIHKIWGQPMAIISGDALFAKVFEALGENAKNENLSADKTIRIMDTVSKTSFKICQGQVMDMEFEKRDEVPMDEYMEMVEKKTGVLIETSTKTGAILGGGTEEEIEALADYGRLAGIAFQIQDDYLGAIGEQEKVGKPIGSDIRKGKWTYLVVEAYEKGSEEDKETLKELLGKKNASKEEIEKIIEIYRKTDAINSAKNKAKTLTEEAKSKLDVLPESQSKEFLLKLADFIVEREL